MSACYTSHTFPRHWHESFVIEIVESGVDEFQCRGTVFNAPAGSIVVFNPGEVHTGRPVGGVPLKYRSLYPSVDLMRMLSKVHRVLFNRSAEPGSESSGLVEVL
ncbi:AraC family ligand binding domain-containing protein [bacterium]|nr:AraC family ligand binding domain-containing protein [bacterium]